MFTYVLGTLFLGLPLPISSLKRWGTRMIRDGIYIMVLVNIWVPMQELAMVIGSMLGASWSNFFSWCGTTVQNQLEILSIIEVIYSTIQALGLGTLSALLSPLSTVSTILTISMTGIETLVVIGKIVYTLMGVFSAMGIMLIALPFRVGRVIGSSLLAFSIIFYAGLPYLPYFVQNVFGSVSIVSLSYSTAQQINTSVTSLLTQVIPNVIGISIIGPAIYLTVLGSLSLGLASAISGSRAVLPISIDVF
ncbi:hypothetical protein HS7_06020 [Sulfolobales archaeon HS-7]|nr:hypothetical protein HS7_06020 [Sulfolobales archaeon HS-7]